MRRPLLLLLPALLAPGLACGIKGPPRPPAMQAPAPVAPDAGTPVQP